MNGIERLHEIMKRLRDPEKGCPWDREQTLSSLKPCVLEEAYELLAAMDNPDDRANHIEELGDVLSGINDIERIMSRASMGSANAHDMLGLKNSFAKLPSWISERTFFIAFLVSSVIIFGPVM